MRSIPLVMLVLAVAVSGAEAADRPNVLFIAVDDLNDWVGCLGGHPQSVTPHLDRLAADGTLFTNAHCAAPACNPSRIALMTGIAPHRSGLYDNSQNWLKNESLVARRHLAQHFRGNGYQTWGGGKIYHGNYNHLPSWDSYRSPLESGSGRDLPPADAVPLNGFGKATGHFDWGPVAADDADMPDWQLAQWAAQELRKPHEQPFFLACGIYRPHLPWYVPQKYFDAIDLENVQLPEVLKNDLDDVPRAGVAMAKPQTDHRKVVERGQWDDAVRAYLASIRFTDACLGEVLTALDEGPNAQNTIVVLWSDHGWHLGEKQHWRKFALWERATRVVLVCRLPQDRESRVCAAPVSLLDIYPSLVELCDLPPVAGLDGQSFVPLINDPQRETSRYAITTEGRANHAVRDARYRLIRYADQSTELYDHQADPHEWRNLTDDPALAEVKERLLAQLPTEDAQYTPPLRRARGNRGGE